MVTKDENEQCYWNAECEGELVCNWGYDPERCVPLGGEGDICGYYNECEEGLVCNDTVFPHACSPPAARGEECGEWMVCEEGLQCTNIPIEDLPPGGRLTRLNVRLPPQDPDVVGPRIAATLHETGIDVSLICERIFETISRAKAALLQCALARMAIEAGGRLAHSYITLDDMAEWERKANAGVIVPKARIPKVIKDNMS